MNGGKEMYFRAPKNRRDYAIQKKQRNERLDRIEKWIERTDAAAEKRAQELKAQEGVCHESVSS
jgi:hypothetical protein